MEIWIIVVPVWVLAAVALLGGSLLVEVVNSVESWIQQHCLLICLLILALYAFILFLELKNLSPMVKKAGVPVALFVICDIIRSLASASYVIFFVVGMAVTFHPSYSILANIEEVFGLLLATIPMFSFLLFEKIMELGIDKGTVIWGCILSVAGSALGTAIFIGDYLPTILRHIF